MNRFVLKNQRVGILGITCLVMILYLVLVYGQLYGQESERKPTWLLSAKEIVLDAKITDQSAAMAAFERGDGKGEFIANLKPPMGSMEVDEPLQSREQKENRRAAVNTARNNALSLMPGFPKQAIRYNYDNIFAFSVEVTPEELKLLIANPEIQTIEPVIILHAHLAQGVPLEKADTYRSQYNGQGLSVAICDTGIDYTNTYLGGGGFPNTKVIGGYDVGQSDNNPMDGHGHGTSCAGIVAGSLATSGDYIGGVAYNAKLYALKITYDATGGSATTAAMVAAWDWCVTHQYDNSSYPIMIISTSFGGGKYTSTCNTAYSAMTNAAIAAKAAGMTLFVSSGNDGYCNAMGWPACITHVISVGAVYDAAFGPYYPCISGDSCAPSKWPTTGCDSGYYATDSTYADMVTSYSNSASFLDLYAPSNRAYTLGIGGSTFETDFGGTSAACPYAAGAAAALQSAAKARTGSWLTPDQVKSALINNGYSITDVKNGLTKPRVNLKATIETALPCTYSISPDSASVSGSSGTGSVSVTASSSGCSWTTTSYSAWITVTTGASGTGSGTVGYSYTANNTGAERVGTISIAGKTFTLTQKKKAGLPWLLLLLE